MTKRDPRFLELLDALVRKERELDALRTELCAYRAAHRLPERAFDVVRCRIGTHAVAFLAEDVDEVVAMASLVDVPHAPPWLLGLLELGVEQLPVVDLPAREHGVRRELDPNEHIVVAKSRAGRMGFVVDVLDGLMTLEPSEVTRPPAALPFAPHVLGVFRRHEEPVFLLTPDVWSADELVPLPES